jgi:hypothetical protein
LRKLISGGLLAGLALAVAAGSAAAGGCRDTKVQFRGAESAGGKARFTVEVADDNDEIRLGLMNRESLPRSAGMLFVYDKPAPVSFWMRNTLIPLDMIFMGADGVVDRVHENAVPLDETPIFGGDEIQYVLEINGGLAKALGIVEGSEMRHPAVDAAQAAWPCEEAE